MKSLVTKLSKPVVVFLDDEPIDRRMQFMELIKPDTNGMSPALVATQSHLVITDLTRYGTRLDKFMVRCSQTNPHFYNRNCYKNALVFGRSDWIGPAITADGSLIYVELGKVTIDVAPNEIREYIGELE